MAQYKKKALVLGAGGFIGSHMVKRLRSEGYWVRGVDIKEPEYSSSEANEFVQGDLTDPLFVDKVVCYTGSTKNFYKKAPSKYWHAFDEIYQFAADMGGAGYIFTGDHDADVMHNSATINLNVLESVRKLNETLDVYEFEHHAKKQPKIFYSSSACIYPEHNQLDPDNPDCREDTAYPAAPDSEYGWEKLFSERLYMAYNRNYGIPVRIARYHNIFGPEGTWDGGREKAPAAICRKVARVPESGGSIEVWGDGLQPRSFLFIEECIEATRRLMDSDFMGPVNIGSEQMVSINELVDTASKVAGKIVRKVYQMNTPQGVRGRNSNNDLIREELGWDYEQSLEEGIRQTYEWIVEQINETENS